MKSFVDTYALIAWLNPRDNAHAAVRTYFASWRGAGLVTTEWVLMEVADALSGASARAIVVEFLQAVRNDPAYEIVRYDEGVYRAGLALFCSRHDKEWSLTDCISFVVMQQQGLSEALTGDHHFAQAGYRPVFIES